MVDVEKGMEEINQESRDEILSELESSFPSYGMCARAFTDYRNRVGILLERMQSLTPPTTEDKVIYDNLKDALGWEHASFDTFIYVCITEDPVAKHKLSDEANGQMEQAIIRLQFVLKKLGNQGVTEPSKEQVNSGYGERVFHYEAAPIESPVPSAEPSFHYQKQTVGPALQPSTPTDSKGKTPTKKVPRIDCVSPEGNILFYGVQEGMCPEGSKEVVRY
jgi:hypothetical protein